MFVSILGSAPFYNKSYAIYLFSQWQADIKAVIPFLSL